jgi:ADP-heptose:LPS heptosyltransferase
MKEKALRFLVIRRDNIGDLVCTTPLINALRQRYPDSEICALVNSYNAGVLENNPDINEIYSYTKIKHRPVGQSIIAVLWQRLITIARLRLKHFDYAILAGAPYLPRALKFARLIAPHHIIGFTEPGKPGIPHIDLAVPYGDPQPLHESEDIFRLLSPLGIHGGPGPLRLVPSEQSVQKARETLDARHIDLKHPLIGIHISARKPSQRWPVEYFIELMRHLHREYQASFLLFWSPGDSNNPLHPGDDDKAKEIVSALKDLPLLAYPTHELQELIGALSLCTSVICSDGGAMHLAAGLAKPILCFFGKSSSSRWHPWGVEHILLQPEIQEVSDISVEEALAAFDQLASRMKSVVTPAN